MKRSVGCCRGPSVLTPIEIVNQPGQTHLKYRAGTHSSFFTAMTARLSSADHPELAGLTTRDRSDPSIAMLDAWATVADVLTFYQERIANEGYLRTATERLSVLELGQMVGYSLKPGVASSVFLAYLLESGYRTEIGAGQRVQSLPAPGELPQSFETSEPLEARSEWNAIRPRMTRPQSITWTNGALSDDRIFLKGTANNVKVGDCLLLVFAGKAEDRVVRLVRDVKVHKDQDSTELLIDRVPAGSPVKPSAPVIVSVTPGNEHVTLVWAAPSSGGSITNYRIYRGESTGHEKLVNVLGNVQRYTDPALVNGQAYYYRISAVNGLGEGPRSIEATATPVSMGAIYARMSALPSVQPAGGRALQRDLRAAVARGSDVIAQTIAHMDPVPSLSLYRAMANVDHGTPRQLKAVHVMRQKASLFGYNAQFRPPVAQFTISPTGKIDTQTTITFHDTSTGNPTARHWDFGDGTESTLPDPVHWLPAGTRTVTLTVTNEAGSSTAKWTTYVETVIT